MLDVFIGEPLASRALGQADTLRQVCLAMRGVQVGDRIGAFYTYWHRGFSSYIVEDLSAMRAALLLCLFVV